MVIYRNKRPESFYFIKIPSDFPRREGRAGKKKNDAVLKRGNRGKILPKVPGIGILGNVGQVS
jgi:hypothetical protein